MFQIPDGIAGETMAEPAQPRDFDDIADIYRRNHSDDSGQLTTDVLMQSETFIIRDEADRVIGFAMIVALNCGVTSYGIIHQLEVSPDFPARDRPDVRQSLIEACMRWLQVQGIELMYARTVDKGAEIIAMLRYARSREWVLDPTTSVVVDGGLKRATEPPPAEPRPVQAARYTSN